MLASLTASAGPMISGSADLRLSRPGAVRVADQQFRLDARAADREDLAQAWHGGVGPDIGSGVRLIRRRQNLISTTGFGTIGSFDGGAQVTPIVIMPDPVIERRRNTEAAMIVGTSLCDGKASVVNEMKEGDIFYTRVKCG